MLNLSVYSGRDLQNIKAVLQQAVQGGVTDIHIILNELQEHLYRLPGLNRQLQSALFQYSAVCPECGSVGWRQVKREGVVYYACKACRYSQMGKE